MSALFPLLQLTPSHVTGTETARPIACLPAPTLSPYKFLSTIVILRNRRTGRATILLQYVKGPQKQREQFTDILIFITQS